MTAVVSVPRRAAELRRLIRHELARLGATGVRIYVHGTPSTVRLSDPRSGRRASAPAGVVLATLRELPEAAGARGVLDALAAQGR